MFMQIALCPDSMSVDVSEVISHSSIGACKMDGGSSTTEYNQVLFNTDTWLLCFECNMVLTDCNCFDGYGEYHKAGCS